MKSLFIWTGITGYMFIISCNLPVIDNLSACFTFSKVDNSCTTACAVQFNTDCTLGENVRFSWNFGDSSSADSSPDPEHTFQGNGPYFVTLTLTDPAGNPAVFRDTISFSGTVTGGNLLAAFTMNPVPGDKIYEGCPVRFTNASTGGATSYSWSFGNGQLSNDTAPTVTYETPGNFTVTLTATKGGETNMATMNLTVYESKKFQNLFNGFANGAVASVVQDLNGIYWVALYYGQTAEIKRYSATGNEIGSTSLSTNGIVYSTDISATQNIYAVGTDYATGVHFIKQISAGGSVTKTQSIEGTPSDVKVLSDGNIVVIGSILEANPIEGETDLYIAIFDPNLNLIGTPQIIGQQLVHDLGAEITETPDGNLFVAGSRGTGFVLPDMKIWQLSNTGAYVDEATFGTSSTSEKGYGILPAMDNTLAFCGIINGKVAVGKVNDNNLDPPIYLKDVFGSGTAYSLLEESTGDLLIGGNFADNRLAIRTDANAISVNMQVSKPNADQFHCTKVLKTLDCGYFLAGYRISNNVAFPFFIKTNKKGEY